jgi:hypothetical protein
MRIGAWRRRTAQDRRAIAEYELPLRRAQQNHGPRQQKLLGGRFHGAPKRDWVERLEICCGRCCSAEGARHGNHKCQDWQGHDLTSWSCRRAHGRAADFWLWHICDILRCAK